MADVLTRKTVKACRARGVDHIVLGGGVAANSRLRALMGHRAQRAGYELRVPSPSLCTDNGAMVAALGARLIRQGVPASSQASATSTCPSRPLPSDDAVESASELAQREERR